MGHDGAFVWTPHLVDLSNQLWAITAMVGAAMCGAVLLVIAMVTLNPACRPHLDRVSFRILVCTLLANMVFGITNAIGGKFTGPTWACGFDIFLLQLTLEISSFLLFCVALNLHLVVIHGINAPRLEKFYIFGSIIVPLCLTIPPYALNQYGWDPLVEDCWYSNDDPKQRLAWQIGTQLFWTLLTVAGEIICSITVVTYVLRHQGRRKHVSVAGSQVQSQSGSMIASEFISHAKFYRKIIFRIALYPITSALFNLTSVACVIHATRRDGVKNWTDYRVLLLSDFVYGGRAILYACLAVTDPALLRAVCAWLEAYGLSSPPPASSLGQHVQSINLSDSRNVLSVHIELSTVCQNDNGAIMQVTPAKFSASEDDNDDYAVGKSGMSLKPKFASDIEASPMENVLPSSTNRRGSHLRVYDDSARRQQLARDRERDDFQRRI
ncbi:hypothetical protein C8R45DRAFT_866247 [Mycena sanguinolenta]|nr:hypothetical protein C8R45DRAFT_866247 [Mycena sanguinolenta]